LFAPNIITWYIAIAIAIAIVIAIVIAGFRTLYRIVRTRLHYASPVCSTLQLFSTHIPTASRCVYALIAASSIP